MSVLHHSLIFCCRFDDAVGSFFSWSTYESVPFWACFSLCTLNNTKGFHREDVFIFCLISLECWLHRLEMMILPVGLLFQGIWFISEEQEMTVSQSEGRTEMLRGAFYTLSSSSSQKVNKKDTFRGKQLLVCDSTTEWLVFALLDSFPFPWRSLWSLTVIQHNLLHKENAN